MWALVYASVRARVYFYHATWDASIVYPPFPLVFPILAAFFFKTALTKYLAGKGENVLVAKPKVGPTFGYKRLFSKLEM